MNYNNVAEKRKEKMTGILYFSSTGNSLQIAQAVQKRFGGKILYIPKYEGNGSEFDKIFVVSPVHSFGLPRYVYDFLPRLDKSKELLFILNYGGMIGGADYFVYEYAKSLNLNVKNISCIKMPESFTLYFVPPKFYTKSVLKRAPKRIEKVLERIGKGDFSLPKKKKTKSDTYFKNKSNWHLIGRDFKTNEKCVKCQKCIELCPSHNISFENGKIVFGDKCVACLGCYHRCPQKAIQFKNKKKKYRYTNPNVQEGDIGKDF